MQRLKILILSELNNPDWISVPLVGFKHSEALAQIHDVHLLTHARNKIAIEARMPIFSKLTFVDLGWLDRLYDWIFTVILRGDFGTQLQTALRWPYYMCFELVAWRRLRTELTAQNYDCVLRLTPVAPVLPSPWASWLKPRGIPFVIGPINGGLAFKPGFRQLEKQKEWITRFRNLYRFLPYSRSTYRNAKAILAGSSHTLREFAAYEDKTFLIPENGIDPQLISERDPQLSSRAVLKLLFVGRLVPFKACDLALRGAASLLKQNQAELRIVGDGPERADLQRLAEDLGIAEKVKFCGQLSHQQTMHEFQQADIFLFPSLREFGGGVVFEALAAGVVPIVADYGGPGDIVFDAIGFKFSLSTEVAALAYISQTLDCLLNDRAQLLRLSQAGQVYARDFLTWSGKAKLTSQILKWVVGSAPKPELSQAQAGQHQAGRLVP